MTVTLATLLEEIVPKRAQKVKEQLQGVNGNLHIEAPGRDGGEWTLKLEDGVVEIKRGKMNNIDCSIKADIVTWESLINGKLSYVKALFLGQLKIKGDKKLALKVTTALLG